MDLQILETLILVVHVAAALAIIGLVLIQQGRGAEMGAGFGSGASGTVFGSSGSGNFLTRTTTTIAIAFFVTSFALAFFAKQHSLAARDVGIPSVVQTAPASENTAVDDGEVPVVEATTPEGESEIPEQ